MAFHVFLISFFLQTFPSAVKVVGTGFWYTLTFKPVGGIKLPTLWFFCNSDQKRVAIATQNFA